MSIKKKDQLYDRITKIEKYFFFKHSGTVKLSNLMRTKSKSNRNESNRNEINRIETKTRKNFLILKVLEVSELFESNRNEINRIEFRVRIKFESFTVKSLLLEKKNFFLKI